MLGRVLSWLLGLTVLLRWLLAILLRGLLAVLLRGLLAVLLRGLLAVLLRWLLAILLRWLLSVLLLAGLLRRVLLSRLLAVLLRGVLSGLLLLGHNNVGLLGHNNGSSATLGTHIVDLLIVEHGLDHDVTSTLTLEMKLNAVLARTSFAEETESYVSVAEGRRAQHFIVAYFDVDILAELVQFLDRDFHELTLPVGVLSSVVTDGRSPFLSLADLDPD